ncbi:MAG TPA: hypothetical protein G4O02_09975 [Caldilineae bacterium]|nr:hypothetical protein [Caldilineae bacterium]
MQRSTWQIGLIGALLGAGLGLLSAVPLIGCLAIPLALVLYAGVGVFAALRLPAPRSAGPGAGAGAVAGAITSLGYGLVNMIVTPLVFMMMGGPQAALRGLPPQLLDMYHQAGIDPQMIFSPLMVTLSAGLCCISNIVFAAILGAIGGAIAAAAASS